MINYIIGIVPSEKKELTGYSVYNTITGKIELANTLNIKSYDSKFKYWNAHLAILKYLTETFENNIIIFSDETEINTINSIMQLFCYRNKIEFNIQSFQLAKLNYPDYYLQFKKYTVKHSGRYTLDVKVRDSIRISLQYLATKGDDK